MSISIILGSSRSTGNTANIARKLSSICGASFIDLADYRILPFDYGFRNQHDDFPALMDTVLQSKVIILASPVYWYSPSSTMKIFMDRLTDLIKIEKEKGRLLRSKLGAVIATGCDETPAPCFEQIFALTFSHLGIDYLGMHYSCCKSDGAPYENDQSITQFSEIITRSTKCLA